jgi:hypothetical protein
MEDSTQGSVQSGCTLECEDVMEKCWEEDSSGRSNFEQIKEMLFGTEKLWSNFHQKLSNLKRLYISTKP